MIERVTSRDSSFAVWPENWPALNVFLELSGSWSVHIPAMGGKPMWFGIPRTDVESCLRLMDLWGERSDIMPRLRILESAAKAVLNKG